MVVTMRKRIILAAVLSFATFGLQACFYDSVRPSSMGSINRAGRYAMSIAGSLVAFANLHSLGASPSSYGEVEPLQMLKW